MNKVNKEVKYTRNAKETIEASFNKLKDEFIQAGEVNRVPTMYEVLFEITEQLVEKYSNNYDEKKDKVFEYQLERKGWTNTGSILKCIEIYYDKNNIYDKSRRIN